jgi:hypothetical protein
VLAAGVQIVQVVQIGGQAAFEHFEGLNDLNGPRL